MIRMASRAEQKNQPKTRKKGMRPRMKSTEEAAIEEFEANKPTTTPGDQQAEARIT